MLKLIKNGQVYLNGRFENADVFIADRKIVKIGKFDTADLRNIEVDMIDCTNLFIMPGLVDSQLCMAGGSGESGFISQPPRITIDECIKGGITTTVGAIGVDTITKTMTNLYSSIRAFREAGLSSYCYSGGYEVPPATLTGSLRHDIYFVDEIIGAGEISIADRRAPEPTVEALAKVVIDAYTSGLMTQKCGVTRIHVGEGKHRLSTARKLLEQHEIIPENLYFTHMQRSSDLLDEGIEIAKRGSYIDFDIHENDLDKWYRYFREKDGRADRLSFSTDAGVCGPEELWAEIQKCVKEHNFPLEDVIRHATIVPATALKLRWKGRIEVGCDADLVCATTKDLSIHHVMANGEFFLKNDSFIYKNQPHTNRRRLDWHGIRI